MKDTRPNPDELLARVQAEEAVQTRGKLKIFFGAAPGVGKTYAMLEAARKVAKDGVDVVIGYVERHVRPETYELTLGLDVMPMKSIPYRDAILREFDLEGTLERRPALVVVDELAHTNAPGSTHAKRWQDVEQLLQSGIDVYTTLNVQHLESLNDIVAKITKVQVRETVPDSIFDSAHEVELVDLPPDDLIERLQEGKVYLEDQAARAVQHFFQKGNLYALRELALRRTAERVNAQLESYRREKSITVSWPTGEKLLVCVGPSPLSSRLVRSTRRMAAGLRCPWVAVYVETPAMLKLPDAGRERLHQNLRLAEQLGASTVTLSGNEPVDEIIHYAQENNVTKIIVGKPQQPRWREFFRGSFVYELTRKCGDVDVYVIRGEGEETTSSLPTYPRSLTSAWPYLWAVLVVAMCTGLSWLLDQRLAAVNLVMVYLLGVVIISTWFGRGPSILTSVLGVAAFDFFFVPPRWTFAVEDTQYLFTFAVMLITGLVISTLTTRVKYQIDSSRKREQRTSALYALSRELAVVKALNDVVQSTIQHISSVFHARVVVYLPGPDQRMVPFGIVTESSSTSDRDESVAQWAFEHREMAGLGTGTLPGADALYVPLTASSRNVGVMEVRPEKERYPFDPEQIHLLEAFAGQTAAAVERINLVRNAEHTKVEVETERLRNSLLSAVSHDLRTPLAVIAGASSTLLEGEATIPHQTRHELLQTIVDESDCLNRLVGNLLDTTRLEAGALKLNSEWQSLEELLGVVLNRLHLLLSKHPVKVDLPADLPLVRADGILLQQVLFNLLENAAKYSPVEKVIEIRAAVRDNQLLVSVTDHGIGLAAGEEKRIFEKFHRSEQTGGRPGAGLGLTVCRGIIELHGGEIWAENASGGGARFSFTLPVAPSPEMRLDDELSSERKE
ncbi:MAG TPA: sensor histidine kinase KdpD [Gemmatales bacterium]|nr:sensor histidine kinase KdpD [Gemmatales bacterium]